MLTVRPFWRQLIHTNLINKRHGCGIWNSLHHGQTIHPKENFISMNLLQMSFMITYVGPKKISLHPRKKDWGSFLVSNVKKLLEGVGILGFLYISKLFLDFQSKYHFQSDLSYDLKQKRYAQRPPSYTSRHIFSSRTRLKVLDSSFV